MDLGTLLSGLGQGVSQGFSTYQKLKALKDQEALDAEDRRMALLDKQRALDTQTATNTRLGKLAGDMEKADWTAQGDTLTQAGTGVQKLALGSLPFAPEMTAAGAALQSAGTAAKAQPTDAFNPKIDYSKIVPVLESQRVARETRQHQAATEGQNRINQDRLDEDRKGRLAETQRVHDATLADDAARQAAGKVAASWLTSHGHTATGDAQTDLATVREIQTYHAPAPPQESWSQPFKGDDGKWYVSNSKTGTTKEAEHGKAPSASGVGSAEVKLDGYLANNYSNVTNAITTLTQNPVPSQAALAWASGSGRFAGMSLSQFTANADPATRRWLGALRGIAMSEMAQMPAGVRGGQTLVDQAMREHINSVAGTGLPGSTLEGVIADIERGLSRVETSHPELHRGTAKTDKGDVLSRFPNYVKAP